MQKEVIKTRKNVRLKNSGDTVIKQYLSYFEVETENKESYTEDIIEISEEQEYSEKLYECIKNRENAYKRLNQDELRFDDWKNNTNKWQKAIEDIKQRYPKPTKPASVIQKEQEQGIVEKVIVPEFITRKQAKLILKQKGLLEQVEQTLSTVDDIQKIEWSDSLHFERNNPVLMAIAQSLNLTNEQLDEMFIAAKEL